MLCDGNDCCIFRWAQAREQLTWSNKNRDGARVYDSRLVGGQKFSRQIRVKRKGIELNTEADFLEEEGKITQRFGEAVRHLNDVQCVCHHTTNK